MESKEYESEDLYQVPNSGLQKRKIGSTTGKKSKKDDRDIGKKGAMKAKTIFFSSFNRRGGLTVA